MLQICPLWCWFLTSSSLDIMSNTRSILWSINCSTSSIIQSIVETLTDELDLLSQKCFVPCSWNSTLWLPLQIHSTARNHLFCSRPMVISISISIPSYVLKNYILKGMTKANLGNYNSQLFDASVEWHSVVSFFSGFICSSAFALCPWFQIKFVKLHAELGGR